jgi:hypothetical protein
MACGAALLAACKTLASRAAFVFGFVRRHQLHFGSTGVVGIYTLPCERGKRSDSCVRNAAAGVHTSCRQWHSCNAQTDALTPRNALRTRAVVASGPAAVPPQPRAQPLAGNTPTRRCRGGRDGRRRPRRVSARVARRAGRHAPCAGRRRGRAGGLRPTRPRRGRRDECRLPPDERPVARRAAPGPGAAIGDGRRV